MAVNRHTLIGLLVFVSLLGTAVFFNRSSVSEKSGKIQFNAEVINEILQMYQSPFDPVTLNIAIEVAVGNEWDWRLNQPHRAGKLNIFIVDTQGGPWEGDLFLWYEALRNNAVYIRDLTSIIVDYQLIDYLANRYYENLDPPDWGTRGHFVQWIVAHEVGHHKYQHKTAHFINNNMLGFDGIFNGRRKMEIEADSHLADSIIANELTALGQQANYLDAYLLLLFDILDKELSISKTSTSTPRWRKILSELGVLSRHPQYIERTFLLLELLSEASNDEELKSWVKENQSNYK